MKSIISTYEYELQAKQTHFQNSIKDFKLKTNSKEYKRYKKEYDQSILELTTIRDVLFEFKDYTYNDYFYHLKNMIRYLGQNPNREQMLEAFRYKLEMHICDEQNTDPDSFARQKLGFYYAVIKYKFHQILETNKQTMFDFNNFVLCEYGKFIHIDNAIQIAKDLNIYDKLENIDEFIDYYLDYLNGEHHVSIFNE